VMEYLDGEDLSQVLADRGALPAEETVGFVLEACEAIAEAHSLGIVHRDLKPANLFLARRPSGRPIVKVLDFGISKAPAGGKDAGTTSTTALMGSPVYMSPEQMVAPEKVDVRTDVWCLGVVLYEMLTAKLPFEGETMPELVFKVVQNPHVPLRPLRPDLPEGLAVVVDRCLEKNQAERFSSVAGLAKALAPFASPRSAQSVERIQHLLGVNAGTAPSVRPRPAVVPRPDGQTFLPTTSQTAAPRGRMLLVPAALAVVVAVLLVGFFAFRSVRHPPAIAAPSTPVAASIAPTATAEPSAAASTVALTPPSAEGSVAEAPPPSSSVPWWYGKPAPDPHPHASAHPPAGAPTCHVVSFFDADGNKHFKKECP